MINIYPPAPIDYLSQSLVTLDHLHHLGHEGSVFAYMDSVTLGSGATQNYLITTGALSCHMSWVLDGVDITTFQAYEDADRTGTTLQTIGNVNRTSSNTPLTIIHKGTSGGTTDGNLVYQYASGSSHGAVQIGSSAEAEYILKANTKYLLRVTSGAASNLTNVQLRFYEPIPGTL